MTLFHQLRYAIIAVFTLGFVVILSSCSKKDVRQEEPLMTPSGETTASGATAPTESDVAAAQTSELQTVYFDYDRYSIRSDARSALKSDANWLKQNSSVTIQIEGHCDERGTTEYNLALGERRANAVRDYLGRLGIDGSRISIISYGKERPVDLGHDETAWARNRRAAFVVTR